MRRIGEGGMGVVYEASDAARRQHVALKTLSRLEASDVYRLKNEFRALADVLHLNLVRLHELFADEGQWYFTMDLIAGERFDAWVRPRGALDESRLRAALPQLLRAVLAIHTAGKLHRDLKPSNVLVTEDGRVIVLDFGLVVDPELGGVGQTVADESVSGTPAYMAPEQAAGRAASAASDVYAIGVMLFEALTGQLPFDGRPGEMLAAKQMRAAPSVLQRERGAPADLAQLCSELLALEPSARPSAALLLERLGANRESSPGAVTRPSRAPDAAPELVGRDADLLALRDAYRAAHVGDKPVIVLLSGESGIGKSALLERFLGDLRREGRAVVLAGRCYERESVPFKGFDALVDALSRYLRKIGDDAKLLLPREAHALRRLFPVLGRIDAIAQAPERALGDAFEMRRLGFLALGELFGRIRDRQPLVLAIDDWQWSDLDSTTLLLHLVRQADAPRVLLIASHRSEGMEESSVIVPIYETLEVDPRLDLRKMTVGPLAAEAAARLVLAGRGDRQAFLHEARGNPFLLNELARAGEAAAGCSLAEILRARVAALPNAERALLEVLAVAARPLTLECAADAAGIVEHARGTFDALRAAQLTRSSVQAASVECYHDKVRESVAAGLDHEAIRRHHAGLARALLARGDPDPEHLALHFEHAGDAQLAAEHAVRSADQALRAAAFEQAARLYRKALEVGAFSTDEARRLQVALGGALAHAGHGTEAAEVYLAAREGASPRTALELTRLAAQEYLQCGRLELGRQLFAEVLRPFGLRIPRSPATALASLTYERARLWLRGFEFRERAPDPERKTEFAALESAITGLTGSDQLCCATLNALALRRALDAGDARSVVWGLLAEMYSRSLGIGSTDQVPALGRRARDLIAKLGAPELENHLHFELGVYESLGRTHGEHLTALEHFERCLAFARAEPGSVSTYSRVAYEYHRAAALWQLGRFRELASTLPGLVDEAWQRSDFFILPYHVHLLLITSAAVGADLGAERELERTKEAWSALGNPFSFQDVGLQMATVALFNHRLDVRGAWTCYAASDARFRASFAARSPWLAALWQYTRGTAAAKLAAETTDSAERNRLIHEAERGPRLARTNPLRVWLLPPRAAAACARGDRERAVRLLRELDTSPRHASFGPLLVHAARRRLGVLLGGDEGKQLVTEADAFFREGGTVDPEHFVATLMPGLEIK